VFDNPKLCVPIQPQTLLEDLLPGVSPNHTEAGLQVDRKVVSTMLYQIVHGGWFSQHQNLNPITLYFDPLPYNPKTIP
jgi:hypothetical protein